MPLLRYCRRFTGAIFFASPPFFYRRFRRLPALRCLHFTILPLTDFPDTPPLYCRFRHDAVSLSPFHACWRHAAADDAAPLIHDAFLMLL